MLDWSHSNVINLDLNVMTNHADCDYSYGVEDGDFCGFEGGFIFAPDSNSCSGPCQDKIFMLGDFSASSTKAMVYAENHK